MEVEIDPSEVGLEFWTCHVNVICQLSVSECQSDVAKGAFVYCCTYIFLPLFRYYARSSKHKNDIVEYLCIVSLVAITIRNGASSKSKIILGKC